jgi:hypothetical protein
MSTAAISATRLERRARLLAWSTVAWNVIEAIVAIAAGAVASSIALIGFGLDSTVEVFSALVILWQFRGIPHEREAQARKLRQHASGASERAQFDDAVAQRIGETFAWVLVPSQTGDPAVVWEETRVSGPDPLALRVSNKLRNEEALITVYSGARLRTDLDRVPCGAGTTSA